MYVLHAIVLHVQCTLCETKVGMICVYVHRTFEHRRNEIAVQLLSFFASTEWCIFHSMLYLLQWKIHHNADS